MLDLWRLEQPFVVPEEGSIERARIHDGHDDEADRQRERRAYPRHEMSFRSLVHGDSGVRHRSAIARSRPLLFRSSGSPSRKTSTPEQAARARILGSEECGFYEPPEGDHSVTSPRCAGASVAVFCVRPPDLAAIEKDRRVVGAVAVEVSPCDAAERRPTRRRRLWYSYWKYCGSFIEKRKHDHSPTSRLASTDTSPTTEPRSARRTRSRTELWTAARSITECEARRGHRLGCRRRRRLCPCGRARHAPPPSLRS